MKRINKKFIYGTGSLTLIAGICIVIMLLNVISSILTEKFGVKIDATETQYLNFSDEFDKFIKSVDKDVNVYYMINPNEVIRVTNDSGGNNLISQVDSNNFRINIKSIFEKIEKINPKINFEIIDPEKNPDKVKKFDTVDIDDIAFECGEMTNSFNVQEILYYDELGRQAMNFESKCAAMLGSVMRDSKVKVGIVNGHGEADTSEIKGVFDDEAIEYEDFNILTDGISQEYDLIFVYGPTIDFSVDEIYKVEEYLSSGKDMQIYLDKVNECSNLVEYLANLGIGYSAGYVMDNDSKRSTVLNSGKYCIIPQTYEHSIFESLTYHILIPNTVSAMPLWSSKNSIDCIPMMFTSNSGQIYGNSTTRNSYCVMTNSSRITESYVISDVIAGGSSEMYSLDVMNTNRGFLVNSVLWMGREDESAAFSSNIVGNIPLQITENQRNTWQLVLVVVIPFVIIIIGLIVYIKRRYL